MELLLNTISGVEKRSRGGTEHLVAPVTAMRAMNLHKGYVPRDEIEKSQPAWNGTPLTLNHPSNSAGEMVSANSPRVEDRTRVGTLFNTDMEDDKLVGEAWINPAVAKAMGDEGQELVERLVNGDSVSVSTSYYGDRLDAGRYDGEHRSQVMGNLRPDHLALLPNKRGRCSIDDGCMVGGLSANALQVVGAYNKTVAGVSFDGTATGSLDESEIPTDDYESHYLFDGDTKTASSYPVVSAEGNLMRGNVSSAYSVGASGEGVTKEELYSKLRKLNDAFDDPPIDPEDLDLSANTNDPTTGEAGDDNNVAIEALKSAVGWIVNFSESDHPRDDGGKFIEKDVSASSLQDGDIIRVTKRNGDAVEGLHIAHEGDHLSVFDNRTRRISDETVDRIDVVSRLESADGQDVTQNTMNRTDQIKFLVENTDLKRDSLESMGDACLTNVYETRYEDDDDEPETNSTDDYVTKDDLESVVGNAVTNALEADEKAEVVDAIVSNSDDYERDELAEIGLSTLKSIKSDVVEQPSGSAFYGGGGASPHASNSSDGSGFPALSVNERIAEQEADD